MSQFIDQWTNERPTVTGWYWIKWADGSKSLFMYDGSDFDKSEVSKGKRFIGPLTPPAEALCDECGEPATMTIESAEGEEEYCEAHSSDGP